MSSEEKVSVSEVSKHSTAEDCWVVVNGKVYDLTTFAPEHPGGAHSKYSDVPQDSIH
jgi:L-lactate dehydrogenase (cytochrome)